MKFTIKSKVTNFKDDYKYGDIVDVSVLGHVESNYDSYQFIFHNAEKKGNYAPIANGIGEDGQKYTLAARIDNKFPGLFLSDNAAIYEREEL